ncbi:MAG: Fic family protein, partial [Cyanobium sp.]
AAVTTAHRLLALFRADEARLSGLSVPTAGRAIEIMVERGIAREITGGRRNRLFTYDAYLAILSEGADPL